MIKDLIRTLPMTWREISFLSMIQDIGNRSVTNDIENVLDTISKNEEIDIRFFKIAYQDSTKRFNGVRLTILLNMFKFT